MESHPLGQPPLTTPADALALAFWVAVALVPWTGPFGQSPPQSLRLVSPGSNRELPLEPGPISTQGPLGTTRIQVYEDGSVAFEDSPCPHQRCVAAGSIRSSSQALACLPNRVYLELLGGPVASDLDGVTQ